LPEFPQGSLKFEVVFVMCRHAGR